MVELGGVTSPRPVPVATAIAVGLILFSCAARDLVSSLPQPEKTVTPAAARPAAPAASATPPKTQP